MINKIGVSTESMSSNQTRSGSQFLPPSRSFQIAILGQNHQAKKNAQPPKKQMVSYPKTPVTLCGSRHMPLWDLTHLPRRQFQPSHEGAVCQSAWKVPRNWQLEAYMKSWRHCPGGWVTHLKERQNNEVNWGWSYSCEARDWEEFRITDYGIPTAWETAFERQLKTTHIWLLLWQHCKPRATAATRSVTVRTQFAQQFSSKSYNFVMSKMPPVVVVHGGKTYCHHV